MLFLIAVVGRSCCFSGPWQLVAVGRLGYSTLRVGNASVLVLDDEISRKYRYVLYEGTRTRLVYNLGDVKESRG